MKKKQGQRADAQENVQGYREGSDAKVLLHNLNLDVRRNKALYMFLVIILAYALMEIYEEIMVLKGDKKYTEKMLQESKSEAELAIEESLAQEQLDLSHIDYGEGSGK